MALVGVCWLRAPGAATELQPGGRCANEPDRLGVFGHDLRAAKVEGQTNIGASLSMSARPAVWLSVCLSDQRSSSERIIMADECRGDAGAIIMSHCDLLAGVGFRLSAFDFRLSALGI